MLPRGLRSADEVVPRLGVKGGTPALRIGDVAAYDRPIEHLAGHLDRTELDLPLRFRAHHYGLVLCFALEPVSLTRLVAELVRVTSPLGRIWIAVWKQEHLKGGAPAWGAVQEEMLKTDWVDNKILSLGEQIYATQYVVRKEKRAAS